MIVTDSRSYGDLCLSACLPSPRAASLTASLSGSVSGSFWKPAELVGGAGGDHRAAGVSAGAAAQVRLCDAPGIILQGYTHTHTHSPAVSQAVTHTHTHTHTHIHLLSLRL